ncbi:MAG: hypothetical protein DMF66_10860 [Acidobacteria bacterium]|nr:MAG: hypothetical protein DMF66_10860 [Acidobacteriota bacterium]
MAIVVLADLRGRGGMVNKDTVAGGYGSRFRADSVWTRIAKNARSVFLNVPSIHVGYLAAIFAREGHEVVVTHDDRAVEGDLALVLTSLVDYRHEREWAAAARARGMRVGLTLRGLRRLRLDRRAGGGGAPARRGRRDERRRAQPGD